MAPGTPLDLCQQGRVAARKTPMAGLGPAGLDASQGLADVY